MSMSSLDIQKCNILSKADDPRISYDIKILWAYYYNYLNWNRLQKVEENQSGSLSAVRTLSWRYSQY